MSFSDSFTLHGGEVAGEDLSSHVSLETSVGWVQSGDAGAHETLTGGNRINHAQLLDSFALHGAETANEDLTAHTAPEIAATTWTRVTGTVLVTANGRLANTTGGGTFFCYVSNQSQVSADDECAVDVICLSDPGGTDRSTVGVMNRCTTGGNGYLAQCIVSGAQTSPQYQLAILVAGIPTSGIGPIVPDPTVTKADMIAGQVIRIRLKFSGTSVMLDRSLDDGATWTNVVTAIDSTYAGARTLRCYGCSYYY